MFPMNDAARKNLESGFQLSAKLADQMVDAQIQTMTLAQKQFNASFDAFRALVDVQQKAARAMQQAWTDTLVARETAAA